LESGKRDPSRAGRYKRIREKIGTLYCDVCGWPGKAVTGPGRGKILHVHHIDPLSKGGEDEWNNMILLCPNHHSLCHLLYGNRIHNMALQDLINKLKDIESIGLGIDSKDAVTVKKIMNKTLSRKLKRIPIDMINNSDAG